MVGGYMNIIEQGRLCRCGECDACDAYLAHMAERERIARATKHAKPVLCLHKSCYQVVANLEEIKGFGNKGGFYR